MLQITICVGSSCSVHGSDDLAASLEQLIEREDLADRIELIGAFCMEQCSTGISIKVGDRQYREIHPEDAETFFSEAILPCVSGEEEK